MVPFHNLLFVEQANAAIIAKGTAENPIVFTSKTKQTGAWKGILVSSSSDKNLVEFVTVENCGSAAQLGAFVGPANLGINYSGKITLKNSQIKNSVGHCIVVRPSSNAGLTSSDITNENNALGDLKTD